MAGSNQVDNSRYAKVKDYNKIPQQTQQVMHLQDSSHK
jgi:hypothetical protein